MSDVIVTIHLPDKLAARAKAVGIEIEAQLESETERLISALEERIKQAESARAIGDPSKQSEWTDEELAVLLKPGEPKTGAEIASMLQSGELDTTAWSEMLNPDIADPVDWVKARTDAAKNRNLDWGQQ